MKRNVLVLVLAASFLSGVAASSWAQDAHPGGSAKAGFIREAEKWTYEGDGLSLVGILLQPEGSGPFPAIVISHGSGGNADGFALTKAREMVKWGFVCIGTNYTFAGKPGTPRPPAPKPTEAATLGAQTNVQKRPPGASAEARAENLRRAAKLIDILESLPNVDRKRIYAYGNSAGAVLTIAMAGSMPGKIAAAAITAGGVSDRFVSPEVAEKIRCPFLIVHGSADPLVSPQTSLLLKEILDRNRVPNKRVVFDGIGHNVHGDKRDEVNSLIRGWFVEHGI